VIVEASLRKLVPRRTAERGDEYFAQGRVRRLDAKNGVIRAIVQGSQQYRVELNVDDELLGTRCDCPAFLQHDEQCKHIWAVIRAASARHLLPDVHGFVFPDNVRTFAPRRVTRAPWERFLEGLDDGAAVQLPASSRGLPDEIAYVMRFAGLSQALTIDVLGRKRRKDGEWGKWTSISMRVTDLPELDPFDRESLALLHQRWSHMIESRVAIPPAATAWWVERLARAGRLFVDGEDGELRAIAWDDGAPWTFRVAIVNDPARALYRITGSLERDGETMPLRSDVTFISDVLLTRDRAARFDDAERTSWLHALRASGEVEIPHADADRFRTALLRVPIGAVTLPEELGWELVEARPRPMLMMQADGWSTELVAELAFQYDDWRVAARWGETQKTNGRKLIRRNLALENSFRERLSSLPVIAAADGFRVRLSRLEEVARTLISEGWRIEIDSEPLRVTDDIGVEITSGIDWFDLEVSASFGDARVALPELLAAAEAKRSLLRLSDGSFGIVPTAWADSLAPVIELGKREGDAIRFHNVQALLVDALLQQKPHSTDEAFAALRGNLISGSPEPRQEPATMTAELRPYQRAGLGWLHFLRESGIGGCLADDMGLGKTVQALALLEGLRVETTSTRPSLVVAPRSLLFNWAAEAARFAPGLRVREHHGSDRDKNIESFDDCDVVLTTYATMRLDIAQLAQVDFEYVILDEAQAIKNATSQVAKASRLLRGRHRLALSGTPVENHLGELWSLFEFLNPGLLGSSRSFSRAFAAKTATPERREALARALRPLILRRTKQQVAPELPERTEQTLYCELDTRQRKLYDELREHYRQSLLRNVRTAGVERSRMQILEALLRLRQAACHPGLIDGRYEEEGAKTSLLMDELREVLDSGHRALVFSQFTSFLAIVRGLLDAERIPYLYLDGATRDRQSLVEAFQSDDGPPLFLISLKAGGLGLNLTNADYIFLMDPWWNPAVEAQAIDRAHRIGRRNPVVAYRLIARDTVEEKILELQARKRELAESIISEDNSVLRRLEVEDLEMLLS
jgi:superfamily II DNA or RNA helicase